MLLPLHFKLVLSPLKSSSIRNIVVRPSVVVMRNYRRGEVVRQRGVGDGQKSEIEPPRFCAGIGFEGVGVSRRTPDYVS